jgi:SAM-dependent methyltransferase
MKKKITMPYNVIWYILLQRTFWLDIIKILFGFKIWIEYALLRPYLPKRCSSVLDIGCGVGAIDILLYRRYKSKPHLYLLDKTEIHSSLKYGFQQEGEFYNSMTITENLLIQNGVKKEHIHCLEATKDNCINTPGDIDLVVSTLAWGFHFPVDTYLDTVYSKLRNGGRLIIDIRRGTNGQKLLKKKFGNCKRIMFRRKFCRFLVIKNNRKLHDFWHDDGDTYANRGE